MNRNRIISFIFFFFAKDSEKGLCTESKLYEVKNIKAPPGYDPVLELTDEFDGETLNRSKWSTDPKILGWLGRKPGLFDANNVKVENGMLQLWAQGQRRNDSWPEGYDNYTTAAIHSLKRIRHGYFETRWRSGSSGISSSWWFHQAQGQGLEKIWTEIDMFETTGVTNPMPGGAKADSLPSHVHIFNYKDTPTEGLPDKCKCELHDGEPPCSIASFYKLPENEPTWAETFHTSSLNWTETGIVVTVDGVIVNEIQSPCLTQEIGMDISRATMPGWMILPDPSALPDQPFELDYVRAWKQI